MLNKRKSQEAINAYDTEIKKLYDELASISTSISRTVQDIYIKTKVLSVYLKGSIDLEEASQELETTQYRLDYLLRQYENNRASILDLINQYSENYEGSWSIPLTSHRLVENALRIYLEKIWKKIKKGFTNTNLYDIIILMKVLNRAA